jgi:hypothetical protein
LVQEDKAFIIDVALNSSQACFPHCCIPDLTFLGEKFWPSVNIVCLKLSGGLTVTLPSTAACISSFLASRSHSDAPSVGGGGGYLPPAGNNGLSQKKDSWPEFAVHQNKMGHLTESQQLSRWEGI